MRYESHINFYIERSLHSLKKGKFWLKIPILPLASQPHQKQKSSLFCTIFYITIGRQGKFPCYAI